MCKTTKGTQSAAGSAVLGIQPNAGGGVVNPPVIPPNQFDGFQEQVPDRVFVSTAGTAGFLTSANGFYSYFGLQPESVNSIEHLLQLLGDPANTTVYRRLLLVSHAHPRGVIIPFFTGGVNGTNKEVFREFAKSDLDGLKYLSPFDPPIFNWTSVFSTIMTNLRTFILAPANTAFAGALTPFGLQTSGSPSGDLRSFFENCFDIVFVGTAGRVKNRSAASITAPQRAICVRFIGAIVTQIGKKIRNTTIGGTVITDAHLTKLRDAITHLSIGDLNVGTFNYSLSDFAPDNMNYYPTLDNAARAVNANFRDTLTRTRQRLSPSSSIDIRGCRAGDDSDYLVALREFFDRPDEPRLHASAPRWYQSYSQLGWEPAVANRAAITSFLTRRIFNNAVPAAEQRTAVLDWAALIKVEPLHNNFWSEVLGGNTVAFCNLAWRSQVPPLFIPTPGIAALNGLAVPDVINSLANFFNVPAASVPNASQLTAMGPTIAAIPSYSPHLLAAIAVDANAATLTTLFNELKQINTTLGQSLVPTTAPASLTRGVIIGYQQALINFIDTDRLPRIKTFMTAAKDSLQTGDGLYYYMLFAGLPVFFFNRTQMTHNGLLVLQAHENAALQSWYKCIWAGPLPTGAANASTGARINQANARRVPTLQDEHTLTELAMCPSDKYRDHLEFSPPV